MKKNIYQYHKIDSRKNRNLYQYSEYYGLKFIKDYFKIRKKLLKNYEKNNFFLKEKKISFTQIKVLCRKFEIKKKLFKDRINSQEYSLDDYINTAYKISSYLFFKKNYSILSTLLKMIDLILYIYYKKKDKDKNLQKLKKTIFLENIIIKKIIYEQKIR